MMKSRGWRLLGAAVCVSGLVLTACDDGGDGGSTADPDAQGPLAEFFGWDEQAEIGADREFTEEERQQHYDVQEYVVECMQDAGFEYTPEPFWGDRDDFADADDPWQEAWELQQEDPEAYAKEYGYGITTIEYEEIDEAAEPDPSDDPNWEYRESLSEAALEEYEKALWGDWEAIEEGREDEDDPVEVDPAEAGGCQNEAFDEVYGFGDEGDESQFDDLFEKWESLEDGIQDDSRLANATMAWSNCMADAGYSGLSEKWDAQELVSERQSELHGWDRGVEGTPPPPDADPVEDEPVEPVEPDEAELEELREYELEVAWADYQCQQEHDLEEIEQEVRFEHEQQFLDDNRAELEEYRDWMEEQGRVG